MSFNKDEFSTLKISPQLVSQIVEALKNKAFGSVEIYIENFTVTQITERTINKVAHGLKDKKSYEDIKSEKPQLPES